MTANQLGRQVERVAAMLYVMASAEPDARLAVYNVLCHIEPRCATQFLDMLNVADQTRATLLAFSGKPIMDALAMLDEEANDGRA